MLRVVEMLRRMFVFGGVATCNVATNEAHAQMDPFVTDFYAVLTYVSLGFPKFDLIEMAAFLRHKFLQGDGGSGLSRYR